VNRRWLGGVNLDGVVLHRIAAIPVSRLNIGSPKLVPAIVHKEQVRMAYTASSRDRNPLA